MSYKEIAEQVASYLQGKDDKEETTFVFESDNAYFDGTAYYRVDRTRATYLQPPEEVKVMTDIVLAYGNVDDIDMDGHQLVEMETLIKKSYNQ